MTRGRVFPALLVLAMLATGVLVAPSLPERVPIHWNLAGEPDGWAGRWLGALALPAVAAGVWAMIAVVERLMSPPSEAGPASRRALSWLQTAIILLLAVLYAVTLAPHFKYEAPLDPTGTALATLGIFLTVTGVVLRRLAGSSGAQRPVGLPVDPGGAGHDLLRGCGGFLLGGGVLMALAAPFGPEIRLALLVASLGLQVAGIPIYVAVRMGSAGGSR